MKNIFIALIVCSFVIVDGLVFVGCDSNNSEVKSEVKKEAESKEVNKETESKEVESDTILNDLVDLDVFKFNPDSKSIAIGNQEWMDKDLTITQFRNGDPLIFIRNGDISHWIAACKNGRPAVWNDTTTWNYPDNWYYNYYAIHDPRGLAPEGWHVPNDEEWVSLLSHLGVRNTIQKLIQGLKLNQGSIKPSIFQGKYESGYSCSYSYWSINEQNYFSIFCDPHEIKMDKKLGEPKVNSRSKPKGLIRELSSYAGGGFVATAGWGFKVRCVRGEIPIKAPVFKNYVDERIRGGYQVAIPFKTVVIGGREWTTENLRVKHYRNGQPITHAKNQEEWEYCAYYGIPAWCYYNNDPSTEKEQGLLYNWFVVNSSSRIINAGKNNYSKLSETISCDYNSSGIAPSGFDIPDEKEWKQLIDSVGGSINLKSTTGWDSKLSGNSGFNAVPAGHQSASGYFKTDCMWWTIDETSKDRRKTAKAIHLPPNNQSYSSQFEAVTKKSAQGDGYSIRCIKKIDPPKVYAGTFHDKRDGKSYTTIKVKNQIWMSENMAFAPEIGGYWPYNSNDSYVDKHGYLYDWKTANSICPKGWHLPTIEDWLILINNFGGQHRAGKEMKTSQGWPVQFGTGGTIIVHSTKNTNSSGFSALPGGYRDKDGYFYDIEEYGNWWSADSANVNFRNGTSIIFSKYNDYVLISYKHKSSGFCVRCVREELPENTGATDYHEKTENATIKSVTTESGLIVLDLITGDGDEAKAGHTVTVNYVGKLEDGTQFYNSHSKDPFSFKLNAGTVIKGWDEGVVGMKIGGKRKLTIPPELGYGSRKVGNIPANATLVFEVELLNVR